jgi:hypothetical protein
MWSFGVSDFELYGKYFDYVILVTYIYQSFLTGDFQDIPEKGF